MFEKILDLAKYKMQQHTKNIALPETNPLASLIRAKEVTVHTWPYPHLVIDDFFIPEVYEKLCAQFQSSLELGLSNNADSRTQFTKFSHFDAYTHSPDPHAGLATDCMRSPEWLDYFSQLFDIRITKDEVLSLHHHTVGSLSGSVHNDYVLCSFVDDPLPNSINPWYEQCVYNRSDSSQPGTRQVSRSITIIYYLNNECDGKFGGGTAVCDDQRVVKTVSPKNNRLFAFAVGPKSFHTFQSNSKCERNTLIQWFHSEPEYMREKYGVSPGSW